MRESTDEELAPYLAHFSKTLEPLLKKHEMVLSGNAAYYLDTTKPLVKILRLADGAGLLATMSFLGAVINVKKDAHTFIALAICAAVLFAIGLLLIGLREVYEVFRARKNLRLFEHQLAEATDTIVGRYVDHSDRNPEEELSVAERVLQLPPKSYVSKKFLFIYFYLYVPLLIFVIAFGFAIAALVQLI